MKKICNIIKIAFFANIAYFVGKSVYIIANYLTHPEKYIYSSFPWYTEILVTGICCGGIALILGVLLFVIHKKTKKIEE